MLIFIEEGYGVQYDVLNQVADESHITAVNSQAANSHMAAEGYVDFIGASV